MSLNRRFASVWYERKHCAVCSRMQHNLLTGGVPLALATLPAIALIYLDHNALTGTVPAAFFESSSLKTLYAYPTLATPRALQFMLAC